MAKRKDKFFERIAKQIAAQEYIIHLSALIGDDAANYALTAGNVVGGAKKGKDGTLVFDETQPQLEADTRTQFRKTLKKYNITQAHVMADGIEQILDLNDFDAKLKEELKNFKVTENANTSRLTSYLTTAKAAYTDVAVQLDNIAGRVSGIEKEFVEDAAMNARLAVSYANNLKNALGNLPGTPSRGA